MSLGDSIGSSLGRAIGAALSGGSDYVSIVENGALASFVTFTRASTATYFDSAGVMQTAAINTPRVNYDPATLTLLGFLREPQRTNLLLRSAELEDASWTKVRASISSNAVAAPDGTATADKLVEDSTAGSSHYAQCASIAKAASAIAYTATWFAKSAERTVSSFWCAATASYTNGVRAVFNLAGADGPAAATDTVGTGWTLTSTNMVSVGNGWKRCSVTFTTSTEATVLYHVGAANAATIAGIFYTGDGTSGLYVWGAQLEAGANATSYIPTTSAAVTRYADSAIVSSLASIGFNATQGAFFGAFTPVSDGVDVMLVGYGSGAQGCGRYSGGSIAIHDGTTYRIPSGGAALAAGVEGRFAYSYLSGNTTEDCAFNGTAKTFTSDGDIVSGVTTIDVGAKPGGGADAVHIRTLRYYGRRLSGVEQSAITA